MNEILEYNMESVKERTVLRLISQGPWLSDMSVSSSMSDDPSEIQNDAW